MIEYDLFLFEKDDEDGFCHTQATNLGWLPDFIPPQFLVRSPVTGDTLLYEITSFSGGEWFYETNVKDQPVLNIINDIF